MANRTVAQRLASEFLVEVAIIGFVLSRGDSGQSQSRAQQLAAQGELGFARARAQKSVMADALKTVGQHVEQEAADELIRFQSHDFLPAVMAIVPPVECDLAVVDREQAVVGNGDAMGVAAQVVENLFGTAEGRFGINDPLGLAKRSQVVGECMGITESLQGGKELQLALIKGSLEVFEELAPEEARQHTHGEEEARAAGDPTLSLGADAAARNDTM